MSTMAMQCSKEPSTPSRRQPFHRRRAVTARKKPPPPQETKQKNLGAGHLLQNRKELLAIDDRSLFRRQCSVRSSQGRAVDYNSLNRSIPPRLVWFQFNPLRQGQTYVLNQMKRTPHGWFGHKRPPSRRKGLTFINVASAYGSLKEKKMATVHNTSAIFILLYRIELNLTPPHPKKQKNGSMISLPPPLNKAIFNGSIQRSRGLLLRAQWPPLREQQTPLPPSGLAEPR